MFSFTKGIFQQSVKFKRRKNRNELQFETPLCLVFRPHTKPVDPLTETTESFRF